MNSKLFITFAVVLFLALTFGVDSTEANRKSETEEMARPMATCSQLGGPVGCRQYCVRNGYNGGYCNQQGYCQCTRNNGDQSKSETKSATKSENEEMAKMACSSVGGQEGCIQYCVSNGYNGGYCNQQGYCQCT